MDCSLYCDININLRFGGKKERKDYSLIVMYLHIELTMCQMYWSVIVNLTQTRVTREQGMSVEELITSDVPVCLSVEH